MTLYETLKAAGIETDHHESDLYFPYSAKSRAILAEFPIKEKIHTTFRSSIKPHATWIEVPFAFDPFWNAKLDKAETKP